MGSASRAISRRSCAQRRTASRAPAPSWKSASPAGKANNAATRAHSTPPAVEAGRAATIKPMAFAYYERLSRAQQKIYRDSDGVTELRLERPADLHPLVAALEAALGTETRAATQAATEALIHGLTEALGIPRVAVEVLTARPHAKWGEDLDGDARN